MGGYEDEESTSERILCDVLAFYSACEIAVEIKLAFGIATLAAVQRTPYLFSAARCVSRRYHMPNDNTSRLDAVGAVNTQLRQLPGGGGSYASPKIRGAALDPQSKTLRPAIFLSRGPMLTVRRLLIVKHSSAAADAAG